MLHPTLDKYLSEDGDDNEGQPSVCAEKESPIIISDWRRTSAAVPIFIAQLLLVVVAAATGTPSLQLVLQHVAVFLAALYIIHLFICFNTRLMDQRMSFRNQETRMRIYRLLGSIGEFDLPSLSPIEVKSDNNIATSQELDLLEETLQAHVSLIGRIDSALLHLRSATSLQYHLGTCCPNIDRIERVALELSTESSKPNVSLASIRRALAGILLAHRLTLNQLLDVRDDVEQPTVITLSWIRMARNQLATGVATLAADLFDTQGGLRAKVVVEHRRRLMETLLQTARKHAAFLEGALSYQIPTTTMYIRTLSPEKRAIELLQSKVKDLQITLFEHKIIVDRGSQVEGTECWAEVVRRMEELKMLFQKMTPAFYSKLARSEGSRQGLKQITADPLLTTYASAATAGPVEYVAQESASQTKDDLLIAMAESRTMVYAGKGEISPCRQIEKTNTRQLTATAQTFRSRVDSAHASSLLSELKQYLQALPAAHEVRAYDETPDVSERLCGESGELSAGAALVDVDIFLGELSQAMSRFRQARKIDEIYDAIES
ncbi:hypothetical protein MPSEU_000373000 [Mayamaea pseudoterrestris]|nr:hypothetical protein MPSEU_000373000 [Mayamaea pseudoterrestris]